MYLKDKCLRESGTSLLESGVVPSYRCSAVSAATATGPCVDRYHDELLTFTSCAEGLEPAVGSRPDYTHRVVLLLT